MAMRVMVSFLMLLTASGASFADEPVFSGPQVGELLTPFRVLLVYGEQAGNEVDPIELAHGKPLLLVFVHKLTRPGMALARGLTSYAKNHGAMSGVVWLDDDKAQAEAYLKSAEKSLNFTVPVGISLDGGEGPGAYGLNRNVELTILIAEADRVTANFALVQPSVTEGPKIAAELARLLSLPAPSAEEFQRSAYSPGTTMTRRNSGAEPPAESNQAAALRSLMRQLIDAEATEAQQTAAIAAIENWFGDDKTRQSQVGRMAGVVLQRGLGSGTARQTIERWHQQYGQDKD
jgi:hypothetical protein